MRFFFVIGKQFLPYVVKTEFVYTVSMNAIFNDAFSSLDLNLHETEQWI